MACKRSVPPDFDVEAIYSFLLVNEAELPVSMNCCLFGEQRFLTTKTHPDKSAHLFYGIYFQ